MPVISRFNGIVIYMYLRNKEHNPPHIHATYSGCEGIFSLDDGKMIDGNIPKKQQQQIHDFIAIYQDSLYEMWETGEYSILSPIN